MLTFGIFAACFIIFLSFYGVSQAASVSMTAPSTIDQTQEMSVNVSLSCSGCSDSYLRGVFYPSGTNYFGFTQDNSGSWSNQSGSNCTTFFKVAKEDLQSGNWSGAIKVKIDSDNSYYSGPGNYYFKVGRYTASCSSPTWSSEASIVVLGPSPTPTHSPTPTNAPTPTKTPTPVPVKNPTATPVYQIQPSIEKSLDIAPQTNMPASNSETLKGDPLPTAVLGVSITASESSKKASSSPTVVVKNASESGVSNMKIVAVVIGFVFLIGSGILGFLSLRKNKKENVE